MTTTHSDSEGRRAMRVYDLSEFVLLVWEHGLKITRLNWGQMAVEEPSGRARFYIFNHNIKGGNK